MKKTIIVLLSIIAVLFVALLYLLFLNLNKTPATNTTFTQKTGIIPTEEVSPTAIPTISPTANWKTYTNSRFAFSFKYPKTLNYLTDDSDKYVENGISDSRILVQNFDGNTESGDKPNDFQILVLISNKNGEFNMENISSPVTATINGISVIKGTTTIKWESVPVVVFNTTPNKVAFILTSPDSTQKNIFDQILSTFIYLNSTTNEKGTVTGNLCYPSEAIPPGTIVAKNISTREIFTQKYNGTAVDPSGKFSFQLDPGSYHFKFELGNGLSGYYNKCAKTMDSVDCTPDENHQHINVIVSSGKTISGIAICDFYYSGSQQSKLQSTF